MTDQALYFVSKDTWKIFFESIRLDDSSLEIYGDLCRVNILYMIMSAGSGHIGSSFSSVDIMCGLSILKRNVPGFKNLTFFSSKGHDAPARYAVLLAEGVLDYEKIHTLRRLGGLPGHPDRLIPGMITNTGSLGMGISKARGMILADRFDRVSRPYIVMLGDGELQEGQVWESLSTVVHEKMDRLCIIVDRNRLQSDTFVENVKSTGNMMEKFTAFGCNVEEINGHDWTDLLESVRRFEASDRPFVILADTIKGKGAQVLEHTMPGWPTESYPYHSGALIAKTYEQAVEEIIQRIYSGFSRLGLVSPKFEQRKAMIKTSYGQKSNELLRAYGEKICELAKKNKNVVVLDADLAFDHALLEFKRQYPNRFVESGISEQDMVSCAGGLALSEKIPIVHSFSAFLTQRSAEQIYNNATEKTQVIYTGTLAGLIPAGPGHSHQSIRDLAIMSSIPGMLCVEPARASHVGRVLELCIHQHSGPSYIRMVSADFSHVPDENLLLIGDIGDIQIVKSGKDAMIVTYGPILIFECWEAIQILQSTGVDVGLIHAPWLNVWNEKARRLFMEVQTPVFVVENHGYVGGLLSHILGHFFNHEDLKHSIVGIHPQGIPECGQKEEVLRVHQLDAASIVNRIQRSIM